MYLIPNDPLGRTILTKTPGWDLVISEWWLYDQGKTKAPYGVLPGDITIHKDGNVGVVKTFVEKTAIKGIEGYLYSTKNGDYKRSEFWTIDGRLYREEH
jgi:hypothetical protein